MAIRLWPYSSWPTGHSRATLPAPLEHRFAVRTLPAWGGPSTYLYQPSYNILHYMLISIIWTVHKSYRICRPSASGFPVVPPRVEPLSSLSLRLAYSLSPPIFFFLPLVMVALLISSISTTTELSCVRFVSSSWDSALFFSLRTCGHKRSSNWPFPPTFILGGYCYLSTKFIHVYLLRIGEQLL